MAGSDSGIDFFRCLSCGIVLSCLCTCGGCFAPERCKCGGSIVGCSCPLVQAWVVLCVSCLRRSPFVKEVMVDCVSLKIFDEAGVRCQI